MGYTPKSPKVGRVISTTQDQYEKRETIEIDNIPKQTIETWVNIWQVLKFGGKGGITYDLNFLRSELVSSKQMSAEQKKKIDDDIYKKNEDSLSGITSVAGINIYPPDGLSYKDLARWYENQILSTLKKCSDLAISLGKDPNETGKILVAGTQAISTITSAVLASVTAGTAFAIGLASAIPYVGALVAIVGVLDGLGVFKSGDEAQTQKLGFEYNALRFLLDKWGKEYATALAKLSQIDQIEFTKELQLKYGKDFGTDTGNPELNKKIPVAVTASLNSNDYTLWGLLLIILTLIFILVKRK